jgi:hypothetical protein
MGVLAAGILFGTVEPVHVAGRRVARCVQRIGGWIGACVAPGRAGFAASWYGAAVGRCRALRGLGLAGWAGLAQLAPDSAAGRGGEPCGGPQDRIGRPRRDHGPFGSLPLGRHAPTLAVLGHPEDLPDGRGLGLL